MKLRHFAVGALSLMLVACNQAHTNAVNANQRPDIRAIVTEKAKKHGVPVALAHGVVKVESRYNPNARNGIHHGLMQVSTRTARGLGCGSNLFNPHVNLDCGMRYLREALAKGGAGCAGISLYNLGTYAKPRCTSYGRKVLAHARETS